ncbi:MAG: flap endonuclease-1 [Candidatus Heimdallarchaeota archaeon]|nr:flap endonuclease-1 [Candidatus Heimdallarchaeota archaeon]
MGVTNLGDLVTKRHEVDFDFFKGKTLAFDGNNILYQFLTSIRQSDGSLLTDEEGNVTSHLIGLLYRMTSVLEKEIKAVYIFDGKPPEEKTKELKKRKTKKEKAEIAYEEAIERGDLKLAKKYAQRMTRLTEQMIEDAKKFLGLLGIPIVQASSEGEGQAAFMTRQSDVWASCSQDYDSLLFGTPRVARNLTVSGRRKLPGKNVYVTINPELIKLKECLEALDITREQLIDVAILLGTDFNPDGLGVKGVGPKTALKLIKQHKRIEPILKLPKMKGAVLEEEDLPIVRDIFLNPEVTKNYSLKWGKINVDGAVEFLCEERGFSESRVRNTLEKTILEIEEKKKQPTLEAFFGGGEK